MVLTEGCCSNCSCEAESTNDIIDDITNVYKKYNGHQTKDPTFWLACAKAQIKEIEDALEQNDLEHAIKEFVDLGLVSIDGVSKMGFDVRSKIQARLEENGKKDLMARDKDFYLRKAGLK